MKWKSFLLGVITGWLMEWLIDVFYWRRQSGDRQLRLERLEAALRGSESRAEAIQARLRDAQERLERAAADLAGLRARLAERETAAPAAVNTAVLASAESAAADDLRRVEGIGPKIESILKDQGIGTFAALADTPVERLQAILDGAGTRFRLADPSSWPAQAALAAAGDDEGLAALQATLKGGRA